ncbi:MAG: ABC transporter substrate-binding protein [Desulfobacteraceae bacterium]
MKLSRNKGRRIGLVRFSFVCFLTLVSAGFPLLSIAGSNTQENDSDRKVTVTDDAGKTVTVKKPFKRIISLYGAHTENLFALGLEREIIGVSPNDSYPEAAKSRQKFSYHDGPEKFIAAKPDLILIRPMIARGYGPLVRQLERNGITVLSFQPNRTCEIPVYWKKLGRLTGKTERANRMVEMFQKSVDSLSALTRGVKDRKRVYFEAIHSRMKTFTPGSMPIFVLETAGGINVAEDADQVRQTNIAFYGKERLLSRADEIDVYLAQKGVMNRVTVEEIMSEPGYGIIKAIRENRVYLVDEPVVSRPTLRLLEGIVRVGRILYPDRFGEEADTIVRKSIRKGYAR